MKLAVCEENSKFIIQFINDSMFITCHSEIQNIKILLKKCIMDNQGKKSAKRELENARKEESKLFKKSGSKDCTLNLYLPMFFKFKCRYFYRNFK